MVPLCEAYPTLYVIVAYKNVLDKEAWSMDEGSGAKPSFFIYFYWSLMQPLNFRFPQKPQTTP